MKRCMLLVVVFCLLLSMTACAAVPEEGEKPEANTPGASEPDTTEPDVTQPDTTEPEVTNPTVPDVKDPEKEIELVYDMANDQGLSDFFEEKTVEEWNSMGRYTLRLEGLHTPVVLNMDGTSVLSISAFDQTVELGAAGMASDYFDGYSPVDYIRSTEDAVVIRINGGEMWDDFILITKEDYFRYPNEHDGHIALWVDEDGTLGYRQTYLFMDDIEEMGSHVLYQLTSRDQVLHNEGHAEIINGEVVFTAEKTVVFSDHFDADAMFSESKAEGVFAEYETLDELFEANKARNDEA